MDKTAKFLLCENPIADKSDGRLFILHTRQPVILAEVFHFEIDDEPGQMECKSKFTIGSSLNYNPEYIVIGAQWVEPEDVPAGEAKEYANKLTGIMRRMADWYQAYLIWEDSQDHEELYEEE
jgi:hypothetical protein